MIIPKAAHFVTITAVGQKEIEQADTEITRWCLEWGVPTTLQVGFSLVGGRTTIQLPVALPAKAVENLAAALRECFPASEVRTHLEQDMWRVPLVRMGDGVKPVPTPQTQEFAEIWPGDLPERDEDPGPPPNPRA
ncbi:MAG: hypothetical protein SFU83_23475 [Meiothermus sp.]|nr:hypothetical protein [Meiothermus sp.]